MVTRPDEVPSGRSRPARLTSKGKASLKRAEAVVRLADEQMMAHLEVAEQQELKRILHTLGSAAESTSTPIRTDIHRSAEP